MWIVAGVCFRFSRISSASRRLHLSSSDMKNRLPDRWAEYSAVGGRIPGTRFIAFKVPLQKIYNGRLAPSQRFSPSSLLREIEKQNENLGLVVDLTCTKRYYNSQQLPNTVKYAKILTAGKHVPSDDVIRQFKIIVNRFLSENIDNNRLVGVHCTHGLNRTGYLVCRYMIDVLGVVPSEAIERFNKSRGHCIERQNYLHDLLEGKPRSNPELDSSAPPSARNQQHIPTVQEVADLRPPLSHQLWCPDEPCANPDWACRLSAPLFSRLPGPYSPGPQYTVQQMDGRPRDPRMDGRPRDPRMDGRPRDPRMDGGPRDPRMDGRPRDPRMDRRPRDPRMDGGPRDPQMDGGPRDPQMDGGPRDPQMDGRPPEGYPSISHSPRIPPMGFPHPHTTGPGRCIPQSEEQQHFRGGPQRHRRHPQRYVAQQLDDRPVNGASGWHSAPHVPQEYGHSVVNGTDSRAPGPQGRYGPYSRWPGQGNQGEQ